MTVSTTNITSGPYAGNDVATSFSYTFRVELDTQLQVYETDGAGVVTLLTLATDYTVAGVSSDGGGLITRVAGALPTGYTWYIRSNYGVTQDTAFASQGGFFPSVHETAFDKLTFLIQQGLDRAGRALSLPDSDPNPVSTMPSAASRANKVLAFDSAGDVVTSLFAVGSIASSVVADVATLRASTVTNGESVLLAAHTIPGIGGGHLRGVTGAAPGTYVDNNWDIFVPTGGDGSAAWVRVIDSRVKTVAELRTLQPIAGMTPYLEAHTTAGDGGGGHFRGVTGAAPATYTDNNGTIIVPTGGDGSAAFLREDVGYVTPQMFGGTNSAAIQAANNSFATAGEVYFPNGAYTITEMTLGNGVSWRGESIKGVTLTYTGTLNALTIGGTESAPNNNQSISNMTLVGPGVIQAGNNGIYINNQNGTLRIHRCRVHGFGDAGIYSAGYNFYSVIDNCEIYNNKGQYQIQYLRSATGLLLRSNIVKIKDSQIHTGTGGILLNDVIQATIDNCGFELLDGTNPDMSLISSQSINIQNCFFERSLFTGTSPIISVEGVSGSPSITTNITGNIISASMAPVTTLDEIYIGWSNYCQIIGNELVRNNSGVTSVHLSVNAQYPVILSKTIGTTIDDGATNAWINEDGTVLSIKKVNANTTSSNITKGESGAIITNEGAGAAVTSTLPTAPPIGTTYTFVRRSGANAHIVAVTGTDAIRVSPATGTSASIDTNGGSISLYYAGGGTWETISTIGTVTLA